MPDPESMPGTFPVVQDAAPTTTDSTGSPPSRLAIPEICTVVPPVKPVGSASTVSPSLVTSSHGSTKGERSRHLSSMEGRDSDDEDPEKGKSAVSIRTMLKTIPPGWHQFGVKLCVLSALLVHAGLLLGFQIAANKKDDTAMTVLMFVLAILSGLFAMVIILAVDAATRGKKRLLALYPMLGALTGALLWVPIGGVEPAQQRTVPHEQWLHWMFLCAWLGFLAEFIFCSWQVLFRKVLFQYLCTAARH